MIQNASDNLVNVATAARRLGLTPQRVGQLVRAGALAGARVAGHLIIAREDVERLAAERDVRRAASASRSARRPRRPAAGQEAA